MTADVAIEVEDLRKAYGDTRPCAASRSASAAARSSGCSGPNGAGKTTTVEILEGYRERTGGRVSVLGMDPGAAAGRAARADRDRAAVQRALPPPHRARGGRALGRPLPAPRDVEETIALTGLEAAAEPAHAHALGRPAAAAGLRARARRRPRAGLPRRADDRLRPGRAARRRGRRCARCRSSARPSCSPRTTSTRRRRWPTAWRSSRTARSSPRARPASSAPATRRYRVDLARRRRRRRTSARPRTRRRCCTS